jgi:hypothetical protein
MAYYNIILFLLVIFAPPLRPMYIDTNECNEWKIKYLFNSTEYHKQDLFFKIEFIRIDTMDDLNVTFSSCQIDFKYGALNIYVNNGILLDNDLDLTQLLRVFSTLKNIDTIVIHNIKGFNQKN